MSDASLDLRAELARIDRDRAETAKFAAEQNKLAEEAAKSRREPWLLLSVALAALVGTLIGSLPNLLTVLLRAP